MKEHTYRSLVTLRSTSIQELVYTKQLINTGCLAALKSCGFNLISQFILKMLSLLPVGLVKLSDWHTVEDTSSSIGIQLNKAFKAARMGLAMHNTRLLASTLSNSLLDAASLENLPPYLELTDNIVRDIMRQSHETASHSDLIKVCTF